MFCFTIILVLFWQTLTVYIPALLVSCYIAQIRLRYGRRWVVVAIVLQALCVLTVELIGAIRYGDGDLLMSFAMLYRFGLCCFIVYFSAQLGDWIRARKSIASSPTSLQ